VEVGFSTVCRIYNRHYRKYGFRVSNSHKYKG
jgi:hypothetical protein